MVTFNKKSSAPCSAEVETPEPSEIAWREAGKKVEMKEWSRPFAALASMSAEDRKYIRLTLQFKWASETISCKEQSMRAELEAWEIIDCNIRGIVARFHTFFEQISPMRYLTWRQTLIRVLELMSCGYKATDNEISLELLVADSFRNHKRASTRQQSSIPGNSKIPKNLGIFAASLREFIVIWDDLLGTEGAPGVASVVAICYHAHPARS